MPIQAIIPVTPGFGLDLDAVSLTIGGHTVYRETMVIADPTNATQLAGVTPAGALMVDASATTQPVSIVAGAALIGQIEVSDGTNVLFTSAYPGYIQGTVSIGSGPFSVNLTEVGGTSFSLGQQLATAALPVVLTAIQIGTLTPPTAAAIAAAIVSNPPTTFNGVVTNAGTFAVQDQHISAATAGYQLLTDGTNTMGAMAVFGTTPTAVDAINANTSVFATYNSSPISNPSNGAFVPVQADLNGNLKTMFGLTTQTLTAWTSVNFTGGFTVVLAANTGCEAVIIQLDQSSGTFTGGAVTWQGTYDNTNWVTIPADQVLDPTSTFFVGIGNPYTFVTNTKKPFLILMGGYQSIRALETAALTGTGTITPYVTQLAYAPVSYQQVQGVSVTGVAPVGNPVVVGGVGTSGLTTQIQTDTSGNLIQSIQVSAPDGIFNTQACYPVNANDLICMTIVAPYLYNGTSWDRARDAGIGNAVASTGIQVMAPYGEFLTSLPTLTNGTYGAIQLDAKGQTLIDVNYVLGALHAKTNSLFTAITDQTNVITAAISAMGVAPTGTEVMMVNAVNFGYTGSVYSALTVNSTTTTSKVAIDVNHLSVNGVQIVTAAAGVQKVGIVGNAGATLDYAIGASVSTPNTVLVGTVASAAGQSEGGGSVNSLQSDTSTGSVFVENVPTPTPVVALTPKAISTTAQQVLKASAGNLYGCLLLNLAEVTTTSTVEVMYVHFFNTTTTASLSTTNWLFALPIPASVTGSLGNTGQAHPLSIPPGAMALANFSNGIVIVISASSTSGTTAGGTAPVGVIWIK